MNKYLVIFTSHYPYGMGEEFIETEIQYLSRNFKTIIIISSDIESHRMRKIPNNVKSYRLSKQVSCKDRILKYKKLWVADFWRLFIHNEKGQSIFCIKALYVKFSKLIWRIFLAEKHHTNIIKILRENNINDFRKCVFYSYWLNNNAVDLLFIKHLIKDSKTICRAHNSDLYLFDKSSHGDISFDFIIKRLNGIMCISQHGLNYFKTRLTEQNSNNIYVRYLGVNKQVKIETGNDRGILRLISVSSFKGVKRLQLLIDSLSGIDEKIKWIHIGYSSEAESMIEYAHKALNDSEYIKYEFKRYMDNDEIMKLYQLFKPNVFINVSKREGIPVSIMEAMSFGVPVIATDVFGNSEIVDDVNGYILPANPSLSDIRKALECFIIMDNTIYNSKRKYAYLTWKNRFNAEINYEEFAEFLKVI